MVLSTAYGGSSMNELAIGEWGEVYDEILSSGKIRAFVYYRNHLGQRRRMQATAKSKSAAHREVIAKVKAALDGTKMGNTNMLFGQAIDEWLAYFAQQVDKGLRSESSKDFYVSGAEKHIKPVLGQLRVGDLRVGIFDHFISEIHSKYSYSVAKQCRSILSGTCGFLVRRDLIPVNYIRDVGRIEQGRISPTRALTNDELRSWLQVLNESEYAQRKDLLELVLMLLATGLRLGEALALTWADIDFNQGTVTAEWNIVRKKGQGLCRVKTKTATSDRKLALPRWCVRMLQARRIKPWLSTTPESPIFPSSVGTWRDRSNVGRDLRKVRKGTAVDWFVSHTARRTVATIMDQSGLTARSIADQLGHARVSMTQDHYLGRKVATSLAAGALEWIGTGWTDRSRHVAELPSSLAGKKSNPLPRN